MNSADDTIRLGEPFYCFKFNSDTCSWQRFEIVDYQVRKLYRHWDFFFQKPRITLDTRYHIDSKKFDRFVSGKIYTFVDDLDRVKKIAYETIEAEMLNLEQRHNKLHDMLVCMEEERNDNFNRR